MTSTFPPKLLQRVLGSALALAVCAISAAQQAKAADPIKIGFLVKQAEEPWFQDEWKYAEQAGREKGFTVVKIAVPNGEKMIAAIDNLAAQKAQGFVICAPDVKLGSAVARAAKRSGMKVMSVDDQLLDGAGKPIADIPHIGISGYDIGKQVGAAILAEIKARGWKITEVGALRVSFDQLPTAKERTMGAADTLKAAGLPAGNVVDAPQAKTDTENAFNAANIAFTKNARFKHWVAFALNDESVLGAVRAAEGRGIKADSMIGVGIGGNKTAMNEFAKPAPTGFNGSILISSKIHGHDSTMMVYRWITEKVAPPPLTVTSGVLMNRANLPALKTQYGL